MKISRQVGTTNEVLQIFIQDSASSVGAGKTGLVFNTSGLIAYYKRNNQATWTAISLVTMTAGTYTSGGFVESDATHSPGWYDFCPPSGVFTSGGSSAINIQGAAGAAQLPIEIELTAWSNQDGVHGGMSALPNTAVTTNGSLITSGSGTAQLTVTGGLASANSTQINGSATGAANLALSFNDTAGAVPWTGIVDQGTAASVTGTTIVLRAAAPFANSEIIGAVVEIASATTGAGQSRTITGYVASTQTATVDTWTTTPTGTITYKVWAAAPGPATPIAVTIAANGITNASYAADTTQRSARSNTAQAGGSTSITLDAGASAVTDFYKNSLVVVTGGTGAIQGRFITAYNGSTKVATVTAWATNPDNTSTFAILPFDAIVGATAPTAAQNATAVWQDLLSGSDFTTVGSIGKLLHDDIDATISSRASPTNITAGTITTVTNLTNAPTVGDFTATMKASITTAVPTVTQNADALLNRDMSAVSDTNTHTPLMALRFLRNKWSISGSTLTVTKEDSVTTAYTSTLGTTAGANPVTSSTTS